MPIVRVGIAVALMLDEKRKKKMSTTNLFPLPPEK